jgi:cardiolipin synthase C
MKQRIGKIAAACLLLTAFLGGCASGPVDHPRTDSAVITDTQQTTAGRLVAKWRQQHPGMSGFHPLVSGMDALGARLALIDLAERTIDAQYFLMKGDDAGAIFADKLLEAADRGVRVRVLLDDVFTSVDDDTLVLLNAHPNVELRLFNPVSRRGIPLFNFLGDFERANRRMHNKSFTVDNQVTIVGGRNIAEEYFDLKSGQSFRDLDVFAIGPVAADIGITFDRFWNHPLAVPMEAFWTGKHAPDLQAARAEASGELRDAMQSIYAKAIGSDFVRDLIDERIVLFPATGEVITDDPEKLLNKVSADHQLLVTRMAEVVAQADSDVIVVSPYFIPGTDGVEFWRSLTGRGVRVVILTNSLASNNHVPVHAAYARYRHPIIRAGVELREMRVDASELARRKDNEVSESVTLHVKAIMIDRRYTFIGSLNLDPRSIDINTELGVLVDSADMANALNQPFEAKLPGMSYRVVEDENGRLRWHGLIDGHEVVEKSEPQAGTWRRLKAFFSRILPESQL